MRGLFSLSPIIFFLESLSRRDRESTVRPTVAENLAESQDVEFSGRKKLAPNGMVGVDFSRLEINRLLLSLLKKVLNLLISPGLFSRRVDGRRRGKVEEDEKLLSENAGDKPKFSQRTFFSSTISTENISYVPQRTCGRGNQLQL